MVKTIAIQDSDEVMAGFGSSGNFYRGKWQNVKVTQIGTDENTSLEIRKSLVGLVIPTIFIKERIEEQIGATLPIPKESRLAYSSDVIGALKFAGKYEAAKQLEEKCSNPFDMYVFEKEIYELWNPKNSE